MQSDEDLRLRVTALLLALKAQVERANRDAYVAARFEELRQIVTRPRFDVEVWLVHRLPNGTEDVQRQAATFASRASIAFAPVPIVTARGAVNIEVTSVLQLSPGAAQPLSLQISRRIKGEGPPPVETRGGSDRAIDLPKPGDVLSLELPPVVGPTSDLLAGHAFSLRLRIAPQAAQGSIR